MTVSRDGLIVAVVEEMEKIQVLIIDDDRSIAAALKIILEDNGYEAVVAMNAHQGIEQASLRQFDLIITDVQLPDLSGLDVLKILRKKTPDMPVIIITAQSTPEVVTQAMARGAFQLLPKPFLPSEILDLARMAVAK
jgi:DNA-binding NtrC family response regulator